MKGELRNVHALFQYISGTHAGKYKNEDFPEIESVTLIAPHSDTPEIEILTYEPERKYETIRIVRRKEEDGEEIVDALDYLYEITKEPQLAQPNNVTLGLTHKFYTELEYLKSSGDLPHTMINILNGVLTFLISAERHELVGIEKKFIETEDEEK